MRVAERILGEVEGRQLVDVRCVAFGSRYVAAMLEDGGVGLALGRPAVSPSPACGAETRHRRESEPWTGDFERTPIVAAHDFVGSGVRPYSLVTSPAPAEAAAGLACVNALVNRDDPKQLSGDTLARVALRPADTVGMVGDFAPLVEPIRRKVRRLLVFEQRTGDDHLSGEDAYELLPGCDVVFMTASTIVNGTIDALLESVASCREVVLLGASTPLLAEAFAGLPVTRLSGSVVMDGDAVFALAAEGGGRRKLSRYLKKVNVACAPHGTGLP